MGDYYEVNINGTNYLVGEECSELKVCRGGTAKIGRKCGGDIINAEGDLEAIMAAILHLNSRNIPCSAD